MKELYEELKERNHTARSARTVTSGKKKYMLPSDRLSPGELKKRNGEITVYEMKVPISWAKFKSYPRDIQKEYLQWFVDEFTMSRGMFAEMVGVTSVGVYPYLKENGLLEMLVRQPTRDGRASFENWLSGFKKEDALAEQPKEKEPKQEKPKPVEQPMFFNTITGCEMSMEGKASEIGQMLFNIFRDQAIAVNISFIGKTETNEVAEV